MTLAGFLPPRSGTIVLNGQAVKGASPRRMNKAGLVLVPDSRALFTELTPVQNLKLAAPRGAAVVDQVLELFPALRRRERLRTADLSGGEQQMLAIARVLRSGARLILLDEPTEGLAPVIVDALGDLILEIKRAGITVLLVEQNLRFANRVADRHYLMVHGRIVESLTAQEAASREADLLAHLGV
jgi:branched-chain amino acid transport system ATP-binding protein